jgi:hypothetical protein
MMDIAVIFGDQLPAAREPRRLRSHADGHKPRACLVGFRDGERRDNAGGSA